MSETLNIRDEITVMLSVGNEIKGIFKGWEKKKPQYSGRFMLIEQKLFYSDLGVLTPINSTIFI